ncbi:MAG: rRNA maturation RNase YbeY [Candidatus Aerophobetes bacterium]|nr:rRNA maturation RNase YbeY [Candidatus Aerophobetes bacterium]
MRNLQKKEKLDLKLIKRVASFVLREEMVDKNKEVSIVLVNNAKIRQLNERFHKVKKVTDVLAFSLGDEFISTKDLLGEVAISVDTALKQAKDRRHSLEEELVLLTIHGILHLLDYNDEDERERKIMQAEERKILTSLGMNAGIV